MRKAISEQKSSRGIKAERHIKMMLEKEREKERRKGENDEGAKKSWLR